MTRRWIEDKVSKAYRNSKRIKFKDRIIVLSKPPRIGVCNRCRAVVPFDCKVTHTNHESYHDDDPLKDTIELCVSCHRDYHIELKWQGKDRQCYSCFHKVGKYQYSWYFNEPTPFIWCATCLNYYRYIKQR